MVQGIGEEVSVQIPRRGSNNAHGNRQERDGDKILFRCKYILLKNYIAPVLSF